MSLKLATAILSWWQVLISLDVSLFRLVTGRADHDKDTKAEENCDSCGHDSRVMSAKTHTSENSPLCDVPAMKNLSTKFYDVGDYEYKSVRTELGEDGKTYVIIGSTTNGKKWEINPYPLYKGTSSDPTANGCYAIVNFSKSPSEDKKKPNPPLNDFEMRIPNDDFSRFEFKKSGEWPTTKGVVAEADNFWTKAVDCSAEFYNPGKERFSFAYNDANDKDVKTVDINNIKEEGESGTMIQVSGPGSKKDYIVTPVHLYKGTSRNADDPDFCYAIINFSKSQHLDKAKKPAPDFNFELRMSRSAATIGFKKEGEWKEGISQDNVWKKQVKADTPDLVQGTTMAGKSKSTPQTVQESAGRTKDSGMAAESSAATKESVAGSFLEDTSQDGKEKDPQDL